MLSESYSRCGTRTRRNTRVPGAFRALDEPEFPGLPGAHPRVEVENQIHPVVRICLLRTDRPCLDSGAQPGFGLE